MQDLEKAMGELARQGKLDQLKALAGSRDGQELGGVKVVGPGTAGQGRDTTYAWIQIFENGGIAVEIRDI